jgi:hypothetical protein
MLCQHLTERELVARSRTYTSAFEINDLTQRLGRFHDGNCLYGDPIAKSGALTIDDAWDIDVRAHAMFLSGFDHLVVCADSLVCVSNGVPIDQMNGHTVSIGGNGDFAPFCIS